jgi:ketosteroid isomerase-like protein
MYPVSRTGGDNPTGGGGAAPGAVDVVTAFLACGGRRDFATARALLAEDVVRAGPDGDLKSGREEYVGYLEQVLGDVRDYSYRVARAVPSADGRTVTVELDESLEEADGTRLSVSEAMVFDLTPDRLISRISVYMKVAPGTAP